MKAAWHALLRLYTVATGFLVATALALALVAWLHAYVPLLLVTAVVLGGLWRLLRSYP